MQFQAPQGVVNNEAKNQIAHQIAKINHLNDKKTDGFLEALRGERLDLNGLPFAMGDACRTKGERSRQFNLAVATVRRALQSSVTPGAAVPRPSVTVPVQTNADTNQLASSTRQTAPTAGGPQGPGQPIAPAPTPGFSASTNSPDADTFWEQYRTLCAQEDRAQAHIRSGEARVRHAGPRRGVDASAGADVAGNASGAGQVPVLGLACRGDPLPGPAGHLLGRGGSPPNRAGRPKGSPRARLYRRSDEWPALPLAGRGSPRCRGRGQTRTHRSAAPTR